MHISYTACILRKLGYLQKSAAKTLSFGEKIAKIGPAYPEIICLQESLKKIKKKEINASKTYSHFDKFAERAKLTC